MRSVTVVLVELVLLSMVYAATESPVTSAEATNTTSAAVQSAATNVTANATTSETGVNKTTTKETPAVNPSAIWVPAYRREQCHWSNEVCSRNKDCCSKNCYRAHEGTDYRCTRSSLNQTCVFHYHCRDGLDCGTNYRCCSPYWQNCVLTRDCCDPEHVCTSTPGFIYKKCLYPVSGVRPSAEWNMFGISLLLTISIVAAS